MSVTTNVKPRIQTRETNTAGETVPDDQWQILCDTGAISDGTGTQQPAPTPPEPTPTPPAPSGSGSDVDQFGVKKLYSDGPGPSTYMDMTDPTKTVGASQSANPEGNSSYYPKFVKNSDGSWMNTNGKEVRWAWNSSGYPGGKYPGDNAISKCYDTNNKNGWMTGPNDWPPRVEITTYVRADSCGSGTQNGECHLETVTGHRSTTSTTKSGPGSCELGCAGSYHFNKYPLSGRQKFEKDYHHSFAYGKDISSPSVNNNSATPKWANDSKWHGFKDVYYVLPNGVVQLEQWTDWNADNTWKKTHSYQDDGKIWVPKQSFSGCGSGGQTIPFKFGYVLTVFRADNWNKYSLKNCSVRSIDPTKPLFGAQHAKKIETTDEPTETDEIYQGDEE